MRVRTGLQRLLDGDGPDLRGLKLGLLANPTAVDVEMRHAIDLLRARGLQLTALFGPEHGLRGDAQDMIAIDDAARDRRTGLPVHSLYGTTEESLTPRAADLAGLDALIYDIQDVGARYYTYVWTMVIAMRACARAGVKVIVLDRPNPLGGELVEGGDVHPGFDSFVGLMSVPNRHGLTAGEIAVMARDVERLDVDLTVVEMNGWERAMYYRDTGLPWVMPSPNMPTEDTALVYPGMCLVEGTLLSEGRGTTRPFELSGAPGIDGDELAAALARDVPGAHFRPLVFSPTFHKHARQPCGGVQIHVHDRHAFRPYLAGVAFLRHARAQLGEPIWRTQAYEFVTDVLAIDLLCGSTAVREGIDAGASVAELAATWAAEQKSFTARRAAWLRYS